MEKILRTKHHPEKHHRRSIRLKDYDYSQAGAYFVTICAKDKKYLFGNIISDKMELSEIGKIINRFWIEIPNHFSNVHLDEYIIMPNHLHGIVMIDINCRGGVTPPHIKGRGTLPLQQKRPLGHIIGYFKYQSTKYINKIYGLPGRAIWQRNYYEHIIRNENELNHIREYILYNPLQWQFDRENPAGIFDKAYANRWSHFEEIVYGKIT